jgi:hypothetical protein
LGYEPRILRQGNRAVVAKQATERTGLGGFPTLFAEAGDWIVYHEPTETYILVPQALADRDLRRP